ncbi:MAG: DUF5011 domain-containing protein, partial [Opitutae bacterium]|nr:DUF5011 domain-containing protein [Opitutae bacterium]
NDNINGNHGTLTNFDGSQWVTGRNGNALSFDGANDSVTLPVAAHPTSGDTQVTIAFWCKGGGLLPRNTSILESKKGGSRVFNIHHPWSNGRIYWDIGNGSYDRIDKAASAEEYKDNWVHWAFMKNRTSGSQQIYKDGELWHSGTNMKRAWATPDLFLIGSGNPTSNFWHGLLDDLFIYNRVLQDDEIIRVMESKSSVDVDTAGTYSYKYFVADSAGNKATATRTVVVVEDASLPFIALKGDSRMNHEAGTPFTDPGASVTDAVGEVLDADLKGEGTIDINTIGEYPLAYKFTDADGAVADEVVRTVVVSDSTGPVITLNPHPNGGVEEVTIFVGQTWENPGATVADSFDPDVGLLIRPVDAVAYYSFDDKDNPARDDSTEGKYNGTFRDGATWDADGKFGGAMSLANGGNARMEVGNIDINDAWTLTAHFKELYSGSWRTLFRGSKTDHQIIIENNATNLGTYMGGFKGTGFHMNAGDYGDWHHIAAIGKDNKTRFFIDGKLVGEIAFQSKSDIWRIGAWPGQRFARLIDDVHVFQRALDDDEILGLLVRKSGSVDTSVLGAYLVDYSSVDDSGNFSTATRTVIVAPDPTAPILSIKGEGVLVHEAGTVYVDPGAEAKDSDGNILDADVKGEPAIDVNLLGEQVLTYDFKDANERPALSVTRTIVVQDTLAPVITLRGADPVIVALGDIFEDPGATAVDGLEGELWVGSNLSFPRTGLILDLDATFFRDKLNDGDNVTMPWEDVSGHANHMDNFDGSGVTWYADALNGEPVLRFDGNTLMWTSHNFDDLKGYSILAVSRYNDGKKGRVIASKARNWLFGYHSGNTASWHPEGWVHNGDAGGDTKWHLHAGTMNTAADPEGAFWKDGVLRVSGNRGSNNVTNKPGQLSIGGWKSRASEPSNCEIARILIYDNALVAGDVDRATGFLQARYQLNGKTLTDSPTLDTSREGEKIITYSVKDKSGNASTATRTVIMIDNPPIPEITLLPGAGDKTDLILEAGTHFTDPGFTLANRYGKGIEAAGVQVESTIDSSRLGTYLVTYNYTDEKNNPATQRKRIVNVVDTTPPVIALVGDNPLQVLVDAVYTDPGAIAVDNLDGDVTVTSALKNEVAGLIANWTFNDGTGDKLKDSTGIIDGTLQNFTNLDTAWVDGKFGKALQFDGIDDYVLLPAASKLDLQKMTISLWVNATNYAQQGFIFEKTANGLLNSQYNLFLDSTDELNFRLIQGGNLNDTSVSANVNLEADAWNHVAVTYDGFLKSIFINGEFITAMPAVIPINMGPNGVSTIGAIGSGNDYFFNGLIDDIQIYNRAVPEGEIPFLMSPAGIDTSEKSIQPYVVIYSAIDSSGNAATVERTVVVSNDNTPPVITLVGEVEVVVNSGAFYEDEGATALDEADGNLTPFIDDGGTVDAIDTSKPGEYIITYDVEDFSGNKAVQVTRKVIVA